MVRPTSEQSPKLFVLDTNVILHDAGCIRNFQENDIAIPITVLEELDRFKKGDGDINAPQGNSSAAGPTHRGRALAERRIRWATREVLSASSWGAGYTSGFRPLSSRIRRITAFWQPP